MSLSLTVNTQNRRTRFRHLPGGRTAHGFLTARPSPAGLPCIESRGHGAGRMLMPPFRSLGNKYPPALERIEKRVGSNRQCSIFRDADGIVLTVGVDVASASINSGQSKWPRTGDNLDSRKLAARRLPPACISANLAALMWSSAPTHILIVVGDCDPTRLE